jgi:[Skp1-protein]-hydroxyproline N-acetylglucosaminyltransferase
MLQREPRKKAAGQLVDQPMAYALGCLLVIYTLATLMAYVKISASEMSTEPGAVSPTSAAIAQRNAAVAVQEDSQIEKIQHMFPIHVGEDTEIIPHPGLALISNSKKIPEDLVREITVPKFFDDSHGAYYGGSIRDYLGKGEQTMTVEHAMSIGSFQDDQETIYCSIASYRDPECAGSANDLFERAKHPDRIRVAVIEQRVKGDPKCMDPPVPCDQDPEQGLCKYRHLIDYFEIDARLGVGPVFARHLAHRHYRGEYFAMQLDSHVRFTQDWDDDMVDQWKSARNEMAILTVYLSDIQKSIDPVTHENRHPDRPIMCASDYEGAGDYKHLRHGQQPEGRPGIHGEPTIEPFWAAGFSFARGHFVIQVPYDQYLPMVFQGEEISIGLRAFTYGYDFYAPERSVCFHMYAIKDNLNRRKNIPLFWENNNLYTGVGVRAMKRLNCIIGMAKHDDWQRDDEEKYGLGKVRTLEKYFKTFGIHPEIQKVEQHLCRFVGKPMQKEFLPVLRPNRMGLDYSLVTYEFKDPAPGQK